MPRSADVSPSSCSIPAFKPRQVLLLQQKQRKQPASTPMAQLKPDDDSTLIFSVALWLQNKGFSKVLKRFLAATQIQDDDWKTKALDLNEVFSKYQDISNRALTDSKFQEKPEKQVAAPTEKTGDANGTISEEAKGKKKKKKSKDELAVNGSGKTPEDTIMTEKINGSYENGSEEESHKASKKPDEGKVLELAENQLTKPDAKKKKKSKSVSQPPEAEAAEDGDDESKKTSKKRKRMASDEKENQSALEEANEESKPKKSKSLEDKHELQTPSLGANGHTNEQEKVETPQIDNSNRKKTASKQPKSSEPTSVTAFQRVKIEEVKFVDERLQDNSYWAKDGAETGYGAKAQEVLGQVRGKGFRHEKTKKKRGSYRGGQIDLQSHSIKFKDSDEE